jgi:hypothetical protein
VEGGCGFCAAVGGVFGCVLVFDMYVDVVDVPNKSVRTSTSGMG